MSRTIRHPWSLVALAGSVVLLVANSAIAAEAFHYPEAKHGSGELKYVNGIPVATVSGSPEAIGEQLGALVLKPASKLDQSTKEIFTEYGWGDAYFAISHAGSFMFPHFPLVYRRELDTAARESGWKPEFILLENTVLDLRHFMQCSAVIVEADRSATGGPLFGRNLDWPSVANVHEYTLVVIYRQKGKHTFASIEFPGMIGCTSGMNDVGLAVAMLDAETKKDGAVGLNLAGVPTLLLLRRVLEECDSVDDAVKLVSSADRASSLNIALCDRRRGAVVEVTTKTVAERKSEQGVVLCTNHFRSEELRESTSCWRYDELTKVTRDKTHTISDIAERLHAVNQGDLTIQTMIFEPASLKLRLAFGAGPVTNHPMSELELAKLFIGDLQHPGK